MKERTLIVGSSVLLMLALGGAAVMLVRAKRVGDELAAETAAAERVAQRDSLRARIVELVARRRLTALPRDQTDLNAFRRALQEVARQCAADPLDGTPTDQSHACVALEFASGAEQLELWTSTSLHPDDQVWAVQVVMADVRDHIDGGRHDVTPQRLVGTVWAAFRVQGRVRIGALHWQARR